jgi:hypothetical protein
MKLFEGCLTAFVHLLRLCCLKLTSKTLLWSCQLASSTEIHLVNLARYDNELDFYELPSEFFLHSQRLQKVKIEMNEKAV